jgi:hypothetical protein
MYGVQITNGVLQAQEVARSEVTADADIHGDKGAAMGNGGVPANYDEVHPVENKSLQEGVEITHGAFSCLP